MLPLFSVIARGTGGQREEVAELEYESDVLGTESGCESEGAGDVWILSLDRVSKLR